MPATETLGRSTTRQFPNWKSGRHNCTKLERSWGASSCIMATCLSHLQPLLIKLSLMWHGGASFTCSLFCWTMPLLLLSRVKRCICVATYPSAGERRVTRGMRVPRKEYARSRHQRLFDENVGKTGKDAIYELLSERFGSCIYARGRY